VWDGGTHAHAHTHAQTQTHAHTHVHTHAHAHTCTHTHAHSQGPAFSRQADFMAALGRLRPSDAKREAEVQAMAINARSHSLHLRDRSGATRELAWFPRSGG
jgi:hypothetical protein